MLKGEKHMDPNSLLKGKKILVVDDEQDVLESLIELLDMCRIDTELRYCHFGHHGCGWI